jgi:hypothetical protein
LGLGVVGFFFSSRSLVQESVFSSSSPSSVVKEKWVLLHWQASIHPTYKVSFFFFSPIQLD